jgi:uncharacterized protein (DUF1800 family)
LVLALSGLLLTSCGGGKTDATDANSSSQAAAADAGRATILAAGDGSDRLPRDLPASVLEAKRFLAQASFGPDDDNLALLQTIGYSAWIDRQFALQPSSFRARWEEADAALRKENPALGASTSEVLGVFWERALTAPDQLRLRVAYALSQIFVLSFADGEVQAQPRALAAWMDMLSTDGLTTYRQLLEGVARHPLMGHYLSHLRNQKEDSGTGRVPDENFAREVMQLFSIGVVKLNLDGSPQLLDGQPQETYAAADVSGMARVFTGWSYACPGYPSYNCFYYGGTGGVDNAIDPDREFKPMLGYPSFHTLEAKTFLGVTIPQQSRADPPGDLKRALDTLDAHPNVAPFIGRQLIQRLVTSNPSPAYVAAISAVWANNGAGVRGDIKAVVKAILTHPEARQTSRASGKLREPVLRLAAFLRAFPHSSDTGNWRVGETDDAGTQLGQTPLRAPSVFNFYRPGYVPPNSQTAGLGLVAPEMQLLSETSASGWVNFMSDNLVNGIGSYNPVLSGLSYNRRDLQRSWVRELALADKPADLVDLAIDKLLYGQAGRALRNEINEAVAGIALPPLAADGSNAAEVEQARRNRVYTALLLVVASPEFLVQK